MRDFDQNGIIFQRRDSKSKQLLISVTVYCKICCNRKKVRSLAISKVVADFSVNHFDCVATQKQNR